MKSGWRYRLSPDDWREVSPVEMAPSLHGRAVVRSWADRRSWLWMGAALICAAITISADVFGIAWMSWAVIPGIACLRQEGYWRGWRNGWSAR